MKKFTRKTQKLETRNKLVAAAIKLFSRNGIVSTSTESIAKAAGVSHGTLFLHFRTRDDLVFAVITRFGEHLCKAFKEHTEKNIKNLKGVLKAHLTVVEEFEDFYAHLVMELALLAPKIKSYFFIVQATVSHRMFIHAEHEMKLGKIRKIKRPLLFNTWISLLHYYLINREIFSPNQSVMSEKSKELLEHFLHLVKP